MNTPGDTNVPVPPVQNPNAPVNSPLKDLLKQLHLNIPTTALYLRRYFKVVILFFLVGNMFFLDFMLVKNELKQKQTDAANSLYTQLYNSISNPTSIAPSETQCASCEAKIDKALDRIKDLEGALSVTPTPSPKPTTAPRPTHRPSVTPKPSITPTPTITPTPGPTVTVAGVKEYYVLFGSGSGQGSDWTDVGGLQTSINTSLYPAIKTVTFEIVGNTPTGNQIVWVRLFNATDNVAVDNSDVTYAGGGSQTLISNPINLSSGTKTYKVQIKTQLQYNSNIESAKIHLILY